MTQKRNGPNTHTPVLSLSTISPCVLYHGNVMLSRNISFYNEIVKTTLTTL